MADHVRTADEDRPAASTRLLAAVAPRRWAPSFFGVVPEGGVRRRPSDAVRLVFALLLMVGSYVVTDGFTARADNAYKFLSELPGWLGTAGTWLFLACTVGAVVVVVAALLLTRNFRLALTLMAVGAATGRGRHRTRSGVRHRGRPRGSRIRSRIAVGRHGDLAGGGHRRAADCGAVPRPPGAPHGARRRGAGRARRGGRGGGTARIHPRCARARLGDVGRREPRRRHAQGDADPEGGGRGAGRPRCPAERHRAGRRPDVGRDPLRRSRSRRAPRLHRRDRPRRHRRPAAPQDLASPHVPGCGSVHLGGALGPARAPRLPAPAGGQGGRARERGRHRRATPGADDTALLVLLDPVGTRLSELRPTPSPTPRSTTCGRTSAACTAPG